MHGRTEDRTGLLSGGWAGGRGSRGPVVVDGGRSVVVVDRRHSTIITAIDQARCSVARASSVGRQAVTSRVTGHLPPRNYHRGHLLPVRARVPFRVIELLFRVAVCVGLIRFSVRIKGLWLVWLLRTELVLWL